MEKTNANYIATFRQATEADNHLETYDHTKLSAVNTCPTWGILRYQMHKSMSSSGRSMALECGAAMHEVFSFIRLVSLCEQHEYQSTDLWEYHGTRLFGADRLQQIHEAVKQATDLVDLCRRGSIAVLDSGEFYDDPRDKRRTLNNMEECAFAYINRWRFDVPVWRRDATDPTSDVGIEIPFDVVVNITSTGTQVSSSLLPYGLEFRLTGRIDGIHYNSKGKLTVHDNKTASRLSESWSMSQALHHQFTGYCVAASVFTQDMVNDAEVLGLAIPLPKAYDFGSFIREPLQRHDYHYARWLTWLVHTIALTREYANNPYDAPKYTHSCNRYFRPCSFIPFCDSDDEDQHIMVDEMVTNEWSPLAKGVTDGIGDE